MDTIKIHPEQLYHFIKRIVVLNAKIILITGATLLLLFLVAVNVFKYVHPGVLNGLTNFYTFLFFVVGLLLTATIFKEWNKPQKNFTILTLPVSNFQKFLGLWLVSGPLYILTFLSLLLIVSVAGDLWLGNTILFDQFFQYHFLENIKKYLVIHTVFFLGASHFRGNSLIKTFLTIILTTTIILLYTIATVYLIYGGFMEKEFGGAEFGFMENIPVQYLLAPFLLIVAYYKIKEREA